MIGSRGPGISFQDHVTKDLAQLLDGTKHAMMSKRILSALCSVQAVSIKDGATSTGVEQDRCGYWISLALYLIYGISWLRIRWYFHEFFFLQISVIEMDKVLLIRVLDNRIDSRIKKIYRISRVKFNFRIERIANWYKHLFQSLHQMIKHWTCSKTWLSDPINIYIYIITSSELFEISIVSVVLNTLTFTLRATSLTRHYLSR